MKVLGFPCYCGLMWTKERIQHLLRTNDLAVERAIVVLYDRQTHDEKRDADTKHTNQVGFRSNHASTGSFMARIILNGWKKPRGKLRCHLFENKLAKARGIVLQYTRQLAEEANAREARASLESSKVEDQDPPSEPPDEAPVGNETLEEAMQRMEARRSRSTSS